MVGGLARTALGLGVACWTLQWVPEIVAVGLIYAFAANLVVQALAPARA